MLPMFNLCEGVLWWTIAIGMAVAAFHYRGYRDLLLTASVLFVAFGASDFVEMFTGAWYDPWWLLAWKAINLVCLIVVYVIYRRRCTSNQKSASRETS